jgi:MFS superfamily sulfate permease-like transporter
MLEINIEFVKGVLVVRLEGKLNNISVKSIRDNLLTIIKNGGIKYLMFNLTESVLEERIDMFEECNKLIKKNKGKMYICGFNKKTENLITNNYYTVDNELSILNKIEAC